MHLQLLALNFNRTSIFLCINLGVHCCALLQDLDVATYAKLVCALLDIPVHSDGTLIESLHLLLTLHLSFKNNPYFQAQGGRSSCGGGSSRPLSTV